jgi:hypothetical protein
MDAQIVDAIVGLVLLYPDQGNYRGSFLDVGFAPGVSAFAACPLAVACGLELFNESGLLELGENADDLAHGDAHRGRFLPALVEGTGWLSVCFIGRYPALCCRVSLGR